MYLFDPKLLAFFRKLTTPMPRMVVQVTGFVGHQFHCKLGRTTTAILESMARFEVCCFGRRRSFVPLSLDAFVFRIKCVNRNHLKDYK